MSNKSIKESFKKSSESTFSIKHIFKYVDFIVTIPVLTILISTPFLSILREDSPSASLQLYWGYLLSKDIPISEIISGRKFCVVGRYDSFSSNYFSNFINEAERDALDAELRRKNYLVFSYNSTIIKAVGNSENSGAFLSKFFTYGGLINHEKSGACVGKNGFIRVEKRNDRFYLLIGDKNGITGKN